MKTKRIVIGCLALVAALSAHAQRDTVARPARELDGVEVTARRMDRAVGASVPTQTLTRDDMRRLGVVSLTGALAHIAGVTVRDYGGAGGMKTVAVRGIGAGYTNVVYDGVALGDCQTGEIDLSRYSIDNLGSVRLTIGDGEDIFQPARNMSGAAYLSVNTMRRDVRDRRAHFTANLGAGSWQTWSPSVAYSQNLSGRFALSAIAEYTTSKNDYPFTLTNVTRKTRERRQHSAMRAGHGEVNFSWNISPRHALDGKVYYYDSDRQLPGIVHYYTQDNDERLRERNAFGQIGYRATLLPSLRLKAFAKANSLRTDYHNGNQGAKMGAIYDQQEYYASAALL